MTNPALIWSLVGTLLMAFATGMHAWSATAGYFLASACYAFATVIGVQNSKRKPASPETVHRVRAAMARIALALAALATIASIVMFFITSHLAAAALADGFVYPQYAVAWWTTKLPYIFAGLAALSLCVGAWIWRFSKSLALNAVALNIAE